MRTVFSSLKSIQVASPSLNEVPSDPITDTLAFHQHLSLSLFNLSWVSDQLGTRPVKSWAAGCQDYLKHIEQIKVDFKDVLEAQKGASDGPVSKPAAPPVPLFGAPVSAPAQENSLFSSFVAPSTGDKPAPAAPSLFGAPAASAPSLFPNAASNPFASSTPPSLFGSTPAATASPSLGASGGGGLFGGAGSITPSFLPPNTPAGAGDNEEEDEPARPPSPSFQAKEASEDDLEEALLKVKCKFFTKKDPKEQWADHGVNHLEFLREKVASEGPKKSRIVCRNSIGKAVMNAGLYANMTVQIVDKKMPDGSTKKNGIIVNLFNAVEESAKTITLIRLGKEEDVLSLQKLFEDNVKAMSA